MQERTCVCPYIRDLVVGRDALIPPFLMFRSLINDIFSFAPQAKEDRKV